VTIIYAPRRTRAAAGEPPASPSPSGRRPRVRSGKWCYARSPVARPACGSLFNSGEKGKHAAAKPDAGEDRARRQIELVQRRRGRAPAAGQHRLQAAGQTAIADNLRPGRSTVCARPGASLRSRRCSRRQPPERIDTDRLAQGAIAIELPFPLPSPRIEVADDEARCGEAQQIDLPDRRRLPTTSLGENTVVTFLAALDRGAAEPPAHSRDERCQPPNRSETGVMTTDDHLWVEDFRRVRWF